MNISKFLQQAYYLGLERYVAISILLLQLLSVVFETIGIAILIPVYQFINAEENITILTSDSQLWGALVKFYELFGVTISLPILLVTCFICIALRTSFTYIKMIYLAKVDEKLKLHVLNKAFSKYLFTSTSYQDQQSLGAFVNDLTIELLRAISSLVSYITLIGYGIIISVYIVFLFILTAKMTLITLSIFLSLTFFIKKILVKSGGSSISFTDANQKMSAFLVQRLKSAGLVKLCGMEAAEIRSMEELTKKQHDYMLHLKYLMARIDVVIEPVVVSIGLLIFYFGISTFSLKIEELGLFLIVLVRLLPIVKETLKMRQSQISLVGSIEAVCNRIKEMEDAAEIDDGEEIFKSFKNGITFKDVTLYYPNKKEHPALTEINIFIPKGKMTALVGPSGSGKSTLINLLPRLRKPQFGSIWLDEKNLTEYSLASLRVKIAYVPQAPMIFSVTIKEHIRYGRKNATDNDIIKAANLSGANEFIQKLPDAYDTLLGEDGLGLSGGQKQRLDLARALVKNTEVLILDEPTSNLDAESEMLFKESLWRIRNETDTTIIIIGHRLSTIQDADQIIVLHDSKVISTGYHEQLLEINPWYNNAWAAQTTTNYSVKSKI